MNSHKIINTGFIINGIEPKELKKVPILILDKPGLNKKLYPEDVIRSAIKSYLELCKKDPTRRYIFAKHPKDEDEEWLGLIAGVCNDLYIENKTLYADITLLPTTWGYTIYWLLKHGYTIGTSIRGRIRSEEEYYKTPSGKNIIVKKVTFMEFEGFDFVVFPSYIITQAKLEHIKEQRYLPTNIDDDVNVLCDMYGVCYCDNEFEKAKEQAIISFEDIKRNIKQNITIPKNTQTNIRRSNMMDKELQTEIERLKLEKARHELELEKVQEQLKKAQSELEMLKGEVDRYLEQAKEQREKAKAEELYLEHLLQKKAELEKVQEQIKELEAKKAELEKVVSELETKKLEKTLEARDGLVVRCCGKKFDENNPPKIRVVGVDEEVSNREWGKIDHSVTKKLVYLNGDENIAKEVFGIVDMNQGWNGLKYPVYEHRKSTSDNYDVDLILNLNGLKTALVFLMGRPGMALSRKEKKQIVEFLLKKYQMLKDAGLIDEIPESLTNLAKTLKVMEQVRFSVDSDIASALIETALEKGLVEVEMETEDVKESVEVDVDSELLLKNFAIAISKTLEGESIEYALEQSGRGNAIQIVSYDDGIEKLWNLLSDTDIAKQLELNSKDDFENYIKQIVTDLQNGEIVSALKAIAILQDSLRGTGAVHAIIPLLIFAIDAIGNSTNTNDTTTNTESPSSNENTTPSTNDLTTNNQSPETTQEKQTMEDNMKPEVFDAIKKILETNFDGVKISSEEELVPVIEKLTEDYISTYESEENLKFELAKKEALIKALESGVSLEVAREQIEKASSGEELEQILALLKEQTKPSTESVKEKAGKGVSMIDIIGKSNDSFDSLLNEI